MRPSSVPKHLSTARQSKTFLGQPASQPASRADRLLVLVSHSVGQNFSSLLGATVRELSFVHQVVFVVVVVIVIVVVVERPYQTELRASWRASE